MRDGCNQPNREYSDGRRGTPAGRERVAFHSHGPRQGISLAVCNRLSARHDHFIYTTPRSINILIKFVQSLFRCEIF